MIEENNSHRKKYLNRAIETIKKPNLIVKNGVYNNYIKLFNDNENKIKPHIQIVKVKDDGSFYVTTLKPSKNQIKNNILEGQVIYDLSSMSNAKSTDTNIITDSESDLKSGDTYYQGLDEDSNVSDTEESIRNSKGFFYEKKAFDGTPKENIVVLIKNKADVSTLVHEFAHIYLQFNAQKNRLIAQAVFLYKDKLISQHL